MVDEVSSTYAEKLKLAEAMRKGTGLADGIQETTAAKVRAAKVSHYLPGWRSYKQRENRNGRRNKTT